MAFVLADKEEEGRQEQRDGIERQMVLLDVGVNVAKVRVHVAHFRGELVRQHGAVLLEPLLEHRGALDPEELA